MNHQLMREFLMSRKNQSAFTGIVLKNLFLLLNLVDERPFIKITYLKQRFSELCPLFEEHLNFLEAVRLINKTKKGVASQNFFSEPSLKKRIALHLQYLKGFYKKEVCLFLRDSVVTDYGLEIKVDGQLVSYFAPLRNLLIELNLLFYRAGKRLFLNASYKDLFYTIQRPKKASSPNAILDALKKKLYFGLKVEQRVVQQEIQRLGDHYKNKVLHVSVFDSEAGYDIKSLKQTDCGDYEDSYLEVKAVNTSDWSFFWTRNEKQCSRILGDAYCMVLVPCTKGSIDINSKKEIWNPSKVFLSSDDWASEISAERFFLKK